VFSQEKPYLEALAQLLPPQSENGTGSQTGQNRPLLFSYLEVKGSPKMQHTTCSAILVIRTIGAERGRAARGAPRRIFVIPPCSFF
jgi:hypothetical protein